MERKKAEYKLVYQSGHGNTYCNGENHIDTEGGLCHPEVDKNKAIRLAIAMREAKGFLQLRACDCEYWANKSLELS